MKNNIGLNSILLAATFLMVVSAPSCIFPQETLFPTLSISSTEPVSGDDNSEFAAIKGADCIPDLSLYEIAQLVDIIDGDSIRVAIQGVFYEVRYIGMNTPEYYSDQRDAAVKATQYNKELLGSADLYLFKDVSETDKYDRLLRYVIANGKFINLELVRSGFAEAKRYKPDVSCQWVFDKASKN